MDGFKREGLLIAARMREDIRSASRFEREDFRHMVNGLRRRRKVPTPTNPQRLVDSREGKSLHE